MMRIKSGFWFNLELYDTIILFDHQKVQERDVGSKNFLSEHDSSKTDALFAPLDKIIICQGVDKKILWGRMIKKVGHRFFSRLNFKKNFRGLTMISLFRG